MKLKFKLMTVFAALGVASSGFAAWNFATATSGEANITVGIEAAVGSIGTIDFDEIGTYILADSPNPLVFKGTFNPASGVNLAEVDLTYKVTLNSALADLIDFGSASEGVWVSDVATSITPTWNAGKNPGDLAAYNAIKANLANLSMNVTLSAKMKDGTEPVAPIEIVPGALPSGLVVGPGGLIEFDKDLGPVQLVVEGVDAHGNTDGVSQNFNWTSSDPSRASVVDGLVTPLADGNVTITATAINPLGKGLKKAEGSAAKYDFNFNIVGFTVIPPEPVATKIELVLGEDVTNEMVLDIGDEIEVSARVLDQDDNLMPDVVIDYELYDDETASYIGGVLKALGESDDNYLEFSYEELEVTFFFTVNPAPKAEPAFILVNDGVPLEVPFAQGSGTLVAEVYDADWNVLTDEAVTWSVPNNAVISINSETGAYTINGAGIVVVTARSVSNEYLFATLQLTILEPPVIEHTITIIYGHGNENGSLTVVDGDDLEGKLMAPTVDGYTFSHWAVDGEELDLGDAVTSNLIITAVYTQNTYTVVFDTDGGNLIPNQTIEHGGVVSVPETPTKPGYSFGGWYLGSAEQPYQWSTPVTSSFTLTARWNVIQYTITFDTDGGGEIASETINYGERFTQPPAPTKEGFEFMGWLHNGIPFKFTDAVTGNVNLVADWKEVGGGTVEPELVTLHLNNIGVGTTESESVKQTVVNGFTLNYKKGKSQDVNALFLVKSAGAFVGNKTPIGGKIKSVTLDIGFNASNSTSYHVHFAETEFTAAGSGGTAVVIAKSQSHTFNNTTNPNANYFAVSLGNANNGQVLNIHVDYETTGGGIVTPVTEYNVHFNSDGGTPVASQKVEEGQKATIPANPTLEGKEFVKWLHNGVEYDFNTPVTGDITLIAEWRDAGGPSVGGVALLKHSETSTSGNLVEGVNNATTVGLNPSIFDVRAFKGGANQNIGVNKDGTLRLYYHANGGSILSVSISTSDKISKIVFSFAGTVAKASISVDGVEKYNSTPSSNSLVTIDNIAGSNFAIENVNSSNTQIWLNSIEITYGEASPVAEFGTLDSIQIDTPANKLTFNTGETFSSEGLKLLARDDSSPVLTKFVTEGFTTNFDGVTFNASHVGKPEVTVSYSEGSVTKQASYTILVNEAAALKTFAQINSEDDLHLGATYVIGGQDGDDTYAMSTNQSNNNRPAVVASMSGDNILESETIQKFKLVEGVEEGTYAFEIIGGLYDGDYIYAAATGSNHLKTEDEKTANSSFAITFVDGVASVVAQGTNANNILRFNMNTQSGGNPLFSCYAPASTVKTPVVLYLDTSYVG